MGKRYRKLSDHERCGVCQAMVRVAKRDGVPLGFERHRAPGMREWCKNGTQPVQKPKKARDRKRKKSVWAGSAGLPTLGKR